MPRRVVQKFGGSSVSDVEKIRKVAARVKAERGQGDEVVVVVSAMGDTTDELLATAKQISPDPPRRELDMLLSCGERISMALMSMALHELGVPAVSFTGSQSGIITDETHSQARIVEVRPERILAALTQGKVVIVAGYQGVSRAKEVTTLGRGGSDTSAVALAAALGADCEIYSDVDGVFTADPRVVPQAKKLATLSFEEMQELAAAGAKVLNAQAVEFAREAGITIHARSTHGGGSGTTVTTHGGAGRVKGVTCEKDLWVLEAREVPAAVWSFLEARGLKARALFGAPGALQVLVPLQDVHGPAQLSQALGERFGDKVKVSDDLATVTVVGTGLNADWEVLQTFERALEASQVRPSAWSMSSLQLSVLVPKAQAEVVTRAVHAALVA